MDIFRNSNMLSTEPAFEKKKRVCTVLMLISGLALLTAFIFRALRGYITLDEAFYLNIPYRLLQGDSLIVDEWNLSQFSSILSVPLLWAYIKVVGSTDGVYLFFRYIYVLCMLLTYAYVYFSLSRSSPLAALAAALLYVIFNHSGIVTMWYSGNCNIFLAIVFIMMAVTKGNALDAAICGLLFAATVLCNPYIMMLFVLYTVVVIVFAVMKKNEPALSVRFWLIFTASAAVLAIILFWHILSRYSLGRVLEAIPALFMDAEHQPESFFMQLLRFICAVLYNKYAIPVLIGCAVLALAMIVTKKKYKTAYTIAAALLTVLYFSHYFLNPGDRYQNVLVFPMSFLGGFAYWLCDRKDRRLLYYVFIPGIIYAFCSYLSSNISRLNSGAAMVVAGIFSTYHIAVLMEELWQEAGQKRSFGGVLKRATACGLALMLVGQFSVLAVYRVFKVWRDDTIFTLNETMEYGPLKGIKTSAEHKRKYEQEIADTAELRAGNDGQYVMYYACDTWLYLMDDAGCGSYSAWMSFMLPKSVPELLGTYWDLFPGRMPQSFYTDDLGSVYSEEVEELLIDFFSARGYDYTKVESGYIFVRN